MKVIYFGSVEAPYQNSFWRECSKLLNTKSIYLFSQQDGHLWESYASKDTVYLEYDKGSISSLIMLYKQISSFKPDFVIIGGYKMPLSLSCLIISRVFGAKVLLWMERPLSSNFLYSTLKQTYLKCYCFFLNGILAIGNDAVIAYQTFHKQIYNFPYSIDTTKFIDKKKKSYKKIKFIYLGQLIERKGVIEAIEGFILNKSNNIEFTIVGGGVLEQRVKHLIKNDVRIKQLPYADYDSIPELLYEHDVLIFPSKHDGWALTLVESMCAGLFIMGTNDTSSFNEYIVNQKNGIKINVCKNEINHKIQWCIDNIDLVMDAGPRNQSFIRESLSSVSLAAQELRRLLEAY